MSDLENFRARAAQARADAESAPLANVRDRCLRAEAAWTAMAARVERTERMREARDQAKASEAVDSAS